MTALAGQVASMAKKKKSEVRRHTAMVRMDAATRDRATLAATMMGMSLADYVTKLVSEGTERDIAREAAKLAKPPKGPRGGGE